MSEFPELPAEDIIAAQTLAPDDGDVIGTSRDGRPIRGFVLGNGPRRVSLIGGCHADEPVGPWMLRRLVPWLSRRSPSDPLLTQFSWVVAPHVNPDGEAVNDGWARENGVPPALGEGFDLPAYLRRVQRERPGEDMEFGFPRDDQDIEARPENLAVAAFLRPHAPYSLHVSLHGMSFAGGPWFLIDHAWIDRTVAMRKALAERVEALGYRLHDVERHGEKGFTRIERGFATRPDSVAMRDHFLHVVKNEKMAGLFRPSSMEFVRRLGGDPLTLVSEMPLFTVRGAGEAIDPDPVADQFKNDYLPGWHLDAVRGTPVDFENIRVRAKAAGVRAMPLGDQMRLQIAFIQQGLAAVTV